MNVQPLPSGDSALRTRFDNELSILIWNQTGWEFDVYSVIANTIFELRPTVDDTNRIVDVTMNLGSECAATTH